MRKVRRRKAEKMFLKVCGIRSLEEAKELANLSIDYFGLIFAQSKRQISLEKAKQIAEIFLQADKKLVALVTLQQKDIIEKILESIEFSVIQLHDDFDLEFCQKLHKRHSHLQIWRAFSVALDDKELAPEIADFMHSGIIPLLDTKGDFKGGNGESFNWQILKDLPKKSFVLAGGLSPENAQTAMALEPYCLDFNSKLETNNKKDLNKVLQVINTLKA